MTSDEVLDFWFGAANTPEHGQRRALWFRKYDAFDSSSFIAALILLIKSFTSLIFIVIILLLFIFARHE